MDDAEEDEMVEDMQFEPHEEDVAPEIDTLKLKPFPTIEQLKQKRAGLMTDNALIGHDTYLNSYFPMTSSMKKSKLQTPSSSSRGRKRKPAGTGKKMNNSQKKNIDEIITELLRPDSKKRKYSAVSERERLLYKTLRNEILRAQVDGTVVEFGKNKQFETLRKKVGAEQAMLKQQMKDKVMNHPGGELFTKGKDRYDHISRTARGFTAKINAKLLKVVEKFPQFYKPKETLDVYDLEPEDDHTFVHTAMLSQRCKLPLIKLPQVNTLTPMGVYQDEFISSIKKVLMPFDVEVLRVDQLSDKWKDDIEAFVQVMVQGDDLKTERKTGTEVKWNQKLCFWNLVFEKGMHVKFRLRDPKEDDWDRHHGEGELILTDESQFDREIEVPIANHGQVTGVLHVRMNVDPKFRQSLKQQFEEILEKNEDQPKPHCDVISSLDTLETLFDLNFAESPDALQTGWVLPFSIESATQDSDNSSVCFGPVVLEDYNLRQQNEAFYRSLLVHFLIKRHSKSVVNVRLPKPPPDEDQDGGAAGNEEYQNQVGGAAGNEEDQKQMGGGDAEKSVDDAEVESEKKEMEVEKERKEPKLVVESEEKKGNEEDEKKEKMEGVNEEDERELNYTVASLGDLKFFISYKPHGFRKAMKQKTGLGKAEDVKLGRDPKYTELYCDAHLEYLRSEEWWESRSFSHKLRVFLNMTCRNSDGAVIHVSPLDNKGYRIDSTNRGKHDFFKTKCETNFGILSGLTQKLRSLPRGSYILQHKKDTKELCILETIASISEGRGTSTYNFHSAARSQLLDTTKPATPLIPAPYVLPDWGTGILLSRPGYTPEAHLHVAYLPALKTQLLQPTQDQRPTDSGREKIGHNKKECYSFRNMGFCEDLEKGKCPKEHWLTHVLPYCYKYAQSGSCPNGFECVYQHISQEVLVKKAKQAGLKRMKQGKVSMWNPLVKKDYKTGGRGQKQQTQRKQLPKRSQPKKRKSPQKRKVVSKGIDNNLDGQFDDQAENGNDSGGGSLFDDLMEDYSASHKKKKT